MAWDQHASDYGPVGHTRHAETVMDRIRQPAHELWEAQGRPEGKDLEIWMQAQTQVVDEISLR